MLAYGSVLLVATGSILLDPSGAKLTPDRSDTGIPAVSTMTWPPSGGALGGSQGTCCDGLGFCSEVTHLECDLSGGIFNSSVTDCAEVCCGCISNSDCSDGNPCTLDRCLRNGEFFCGCTSVPNVPAGRCCDPQTGALTPISDGDFCTTDSCNPDTGDVSHVPTGPDGTPCDDDGIACTADRCQGGVCTHDAPDSDSDGDGVLDCFDICPGSDDTRDWDGDGTPDCLQHSVPTASAWGLLAMALSLLVMGKVAFQRLPTDPA